MNEILAGREVIFEFQKIGPYIKVVAMDTGTLTEISISCPAGTAESILKLSALKRLEYVMRKKGLVE